MITVTVKNGRVIALLNGLELLNGIKSVKLGEIRSEITDVLETKQKHLEAGLKNSDWEKYEKEAQIIKIKFANDVAKKTAELDALKKKGENDLIKKNLQILEYNELMEEECTLEFKRLIPVSLLPEGETPNEAMLVLKPILYFDVKKEENA